MGYATASDPFLNVALLSGIGALGACAAMLGTVVLLRLRLVLRRRRERRFTGEWQPLFARCVDAAPDRLPALARADRESFLRLWNHYRESLRGPAGARLNQVAIACGMGDAARDWLRRGPLRARLLAIVTLGNLRDRTVLPDLRILSEAPSMLLSLTAAHAVLRIEPAATLTWLLPLAAARVDWPVARLAAMLAEAGADRVSVPLASAIKEAAGAELAAVRVPRLLKLARVAHAGQLSATVRHVLEGARDDQVIAACVAALSDPRDVALARRHAAHPAWFVRVVAARALGRLGTPEDRERLIGMLGDANWWVRYRAAQALAGLPFVGAAELRRIRDALTDRYGAQIVDQVIAERA